MEIKRVINKRFLLVMFLMTIVNIVLFSYQQMNGRNFEEMKFQKSLYDKLLEKCVLLDSDNTLKLFENNISAVIEEYDEYDEAKKESCRLIFRELKDKAEYIAGYKAGVKKILDNAKQLTDFSIFSDTNSFSYNNIIKTAKDFSKLQELELSLVNDKAVDKFLNYYITFYIALALQIFIIYGFFAERENGMWSIVHSTMAGRVKLGIRRGIILLFSSCAVTSLLYVTTFISAIFIYGGVEDLTTPIQTIEGFSEFTALFNKYEYITYNLLLSWGAIYALSLLLWLLFTVCRKRNHALIYTLLILGIEMFLYIKIEPQSIFSILKQVNIVRLLQMNSIIGIYENKGYATFVISVTLITIITVLVIAIVSFVTAVLATAFMKPKKNSSALAGMLDKLWSLYQQFFSHVPVIFKEFHKLLITSRGIAVIGVMIIIVGYFCANGKMNFSDTMKEKDKIYLEQGGADYTGIIELIEQRKAEYEKAAELCEKISVQYQNGEADLEMMVNASSNLNQQASNLKAVEEFSEKIQYLEQIEKEYGVKGYLISDRGYEQIFGQYAQMRELIVLISLVAAVFLIISESILLENRTGMKAIVHSAYRGRNWLIIRQVAAEISLALILFIIVYGIDYFHLISYYQIPYLDAPVMSLKFMEGCGLNITISGWIMLRLFIRMLVTLAVAVIAMVTARLLGNKGNRAVTPIILAGIILVMVILERYGVLL